MDIANIITRIDGYIWGAPLMILLVGTGLYLTLRTSFIQFRAFGHGVKVLRGTFDRQDDPGEISHFRALSAALSATIGTGNIVGVAAAILVGGPGAVFWMWITAIVGMATKFGCCALSVHFRRIDESGEAHGGPMYYIEMGMGPSFKWLAVLFAMFTAAASLGIGNMFQINNLAAAVNTLLYGHDLQSTHTVNLIVGIVTASAVALVILGGVKRIAGVASRIVPFMCVFYILAGLLILLLNSAAIPHGLALIFQSAFTAPESVAGGLLGGVIRSGVARGLFSNEAGLGSAAIAHGAARTREPIREGIVAMLGPFIDTIVVCTITALVIICTGAYETVAVKGKLTSAAFEMGLPGSGKLVSFAIIFFAFSTLLSWSYYGDRAVDYLFGKKAVLPYRLVYVGFVILGSVIHLNVVIDFCDAMNGLMAIPNLIALITLTPLLVSLMHDYMKRMKAEKHLYRPSPK
ncbi:MAG: sodium:alanine symporter family protein [Deltaproteobacteria bacterium]|jgi:AGCS family alanine or glycine:cation symporter|nr:sodium:alanine symporter family protein [Deltaproteobacteria bacterium]